MKNPYWLFGKALPGRILVALATNGPATVRGLARALGSDSKDVFDCSERLIRGGFLYKTSQSGERRYLRLDSGLYVFEELRALLRRIGAKHPVLSPPTRRIQVSNPASKTARSRRHSGHPDALFSSTIRADALFVLRIRGEADYAELADILGTHVPSVRSVVEHFAKLGILKTRPDGLRVAISFDEEWFAFAELANLLDALVRRHRKYRAFAIASKRNAGGPRSPIAVLETAKLPRNQRCLPAAAERIPFCDASAGRILLATSDGRSYRIAELMRVCKIGRSNALGVAKRLALTNLVVMRRERGRTVDEWAISLNRRLGGYAELRLYLNALLNRSPRSVDDPMFYGALNKANLRNYGRARIAGRTEVVAALERAGGICDIHDLMRATGRQRGRTLAYLEQLRASRIVDLAQQAGCIKVWFTRDPEMHHLRRFMHFVDLREP